MPETGPHGEQAAAARPAATPPLTPLGYGAANLGNLHRPLTDDEAWAILDAAWDAGVRYYDTAPHYGLGLSERRLGAFLRTKPRAEYVLSTKVGRLIRPNPDDDGGLDLANDFHVRTDVQRVWDFTEDGIRTSLADSLERMGLDRVDIAYLHDPERHDLDLALAEALPALEVLRGEGLVDAVGVGSMVSGALTAAVDGADLDVIMIAGRYTLLEQPAALDTLPACHATGTDVVAASVFNSGCSPTRAPNATAATSTGACPTSCGNGCRRSSRCATPTTSRCRRRPSSSRCASRSCARWWSAAAGRRRSGRAPTGWPNPSQTRCGTTWPIAA